MRLLRFARNDIRKGLFRSLIFFLLVISIIAICAGNASADTPILQNLGVTLWGTGAGWACWMGYQFTPTVDCAVTSLGGYFNTTCTVYLFDSNKNQLASASVSASNNWAYTAITPVMITKNSTYYVIVQCNSNQAYGYLNGVPQTYNYITITNGYISRDWSCNFINEGQNMYGMADIGVTIPPSAPSLSSPGNGATGVATSTTLYWNSSSGATSYGIYAIDNNGTVVANTSGIGGTSYTINGLANNTLYYWKVNATNAGGTSGWSDTWSFTTVLPPPPVPTLSSPLNGAITTTSPTLSWGASSGATSYQFQVATDSGFSNLAVSGGTSSTNYTWPWYNSNTTYYWRVNAIGPGGTSAWSSAWTFTTLGALEVIPLQTCISGTQITACWCSYYMGYRFTPNVNGSIVKLGGYFNGTKTVKLYDSNYNLLTSVSVSSAFAWSYTSITPAVSVSSGSTYYVEVWTNGGYSSYLSNPTPSLPSTCNNITIQASTYESGGNFDASHTETTNPIYGVPDIDFIAIPSAPSLSSPSNGQTEVATNPTFSWNASTGATSYALQVATDSGFGSLVYNTSGIGSTSQIVNGLSSNTIYYWRVNATNLGGTSAWSSSVWGAWSFHTVPPGVLQSCSPSLQGSDIGWTYIMGYKFTPTTSGKITRLGGFFNGTKTVKLFDASYNLLASATVTANNTWGYTAITPVNVAASSVYYVAVDLQGTGGAWGSLSVPATCSTYITITTGVYEGGSTFDINHTEAGSYIYGMADIYFKLSGAGDNWVEATSGMPWAQRNGWGCVVFNNKIWIIGGDSGGVRKNDVWYSSDGVSWTQATSGAAWSPRTGVSAVVYNNRIWIMGGTNNSPCTCNHDVWWSTDGVNWYQATSSTSAISGSGYPCLVYNNQMWIIGRNSCAPETWYSTDGANWTQATSNTGYEGRYGFGALVYNNKMWVIGGTGSVSGRLGDVWWSTNGVNWTQATSMAPWGPRNGFGCVVFDNKMWVIGGAKNNVPGGCKQNDVWYSTDGANWTQASSAASWSARPLYSVVFRNKMWNFSDCSGPVGDDWYSNSDYWVP